MSEERVCKIRQFTVEELYVTVLKAEFVKNEEEGWFKMEQLSHEIRPSGSIILDAVVTELKDSYIRDSAVLADRLGAVSLLTGLTLNEFIIQYRILEAKEYLSKTSLSLPEIAKRCGYDSVSAFGFYFRKQVGIPPSIFRRKYRPTTFIVCFIGGNEWKKKKALATPCKGFTKNVTKDILPNSIIYMMALAMNIVVKLNLLQRYN